MDQTIKKNLKEYLKDIRLLLPIYGKDERKFIKDLKKSIIEVMEQNTNCIWEDIIEHFEEPQEVVYNYTSSLDQSQLCKRVSLRKNLIRATAIITLVIIVMISFKGYFYYHLYKETQSQIMTHETVIIE